MNKLEQAYDADMARLQQEFEFRSAEINEQFDEEWRALVDRWTQGVNDFENELEAMNEYCQQRFPPWQDADWTTWRPRDDEELAALRFGRYTLDLEHLEEGAPQHADLQLPRTTFSAPSTVVMLCAASSSSRRNRTHGR